MAFLVSPGVQVKETDLTNIIPAVATSIGGFAGRFEWGPVNEVTLVSSEQNLIENYDEVEDIAKLYPFYHGTINKKNGILEV